MKYSLSHSQSILLFICLVCGTSNLFARMPQDITDAEMALLPKYCAYTQGFKLSSPEHAPSSGVQRWIGVMGDSFWHMHHHCWALINSNRANRASLSPSNKTALLLEARVDFLYVVRNTPEDFVLLPEVLTWLGRNAIQLRKLNDAEQSFTRARRIKPDYWPAYYYWAHSLKNQGRKHEAIELLKEGLQHAPNSNTLLGLYRDLGGNLNDIEASKNNEIKTHNE